MGKRVHIRKYKEVWIPNNGITRRIATFEKHGQLLDPASPDDHHHHLQEEDSVVQRLTLSPRKIRGQPTALRRNCRTTSVQRSTSNLSNRSRSSTQYGSLSPLGTTSRMSLHRSSSREPRSKTFESVAHEMSVPLEDADIFHMSKVYTVNPNGVLKMRNYFGEMDKSSQSRHVMTESHYVPKPPLDSYLKRRSSSVHKLARYFEDRDQISKESEISFTRPIYLHTTYQTSCPFSSEFRRSSTHLNGDLDSCTTEETTSNHSGKGHTTQPYRSQSLGLSRNPSGRGEFDFYGSGSLRGLDDLKISPGSYGHISCDSNGNSPRRSPGVTRQRHFSPDLLRCKSTPNLTSADKEEVRRSPACWNFDNDQAGEDNHPYRNPPLSRYSSNGNVSEIEPVKKMTNSPFYSSQQNSEVIQSARSDREKDRSIRVVKRSYSERVPKVPKQRSTLPSCEHYEEVVRPGVSEIRVVTPRSLVQYRDYPYGFTTLDAERHVQQLRSTHSAFTKQRTIQPEFVERARLLERRRQEVEYDRLRELEMYLGIPSDVAMGSLHREVLIAKENGIGLNESVKSSTTRTTDGTTRHRMQHNYYEKLGLQGVPPVTRFYQEIKKGGTSNGLRFEYEEEVTDRVGQCPAPSSADMNVKSYDKVVEADLPHSTKEMTERHKQFSHQLALDFEQNYCKKSDKSDKHKDKNISKKVEKNRDNHSGPTVETSIDDASRERCSPKTLSSGDTCENNLRHFPTSSPEMEYVWDQKRESWIPVDQCSSGGRMEWRIVMDQCVDCTPPEQCVLKSNHPQTHCTEI